MFSNIRIGRFKKSGDTMVTDEVDGQVVMVNHGQTPQDRVFADNVERTLIEKGLALVTTPFAQGGEVTRCVETA